MLTIIERDGKVIAMHSGIGCVSNDTIQINGNAVYFPEGTAEFHVVPDQPIDHLYREDESGGRSVIAVWPDDFKQATSAEASSVIDIETGKKIALTVHQFCGDHETDGIIRNALVALFNGLGIEAPADFVAWNKIAIAEIEKARIEKEALTNA